MASASSQTSVGNIMFVHTVSETGRLLPSSSQWNAIELDFNLLPEADNYHSIPSPYSKSYDYTIAIGDKRYFKRFLYGLVAFILVVLAIVLFVHFLPVKQKHHGGSRNLAVAVNRALMFFDAQKSGPYPGDSPVKFRGNSGLNDGSPIVDLVGGFYDSGNNVKFTFPTAYTITLLSWSVIEYHEKYEEIGELDHVCDIIKWGSDYLMKVFPSNSTSSTVYSQVGSTNNDTKVPSDISCWQRPEDMDYLRPVSVCGGKSSDLAGEIIAALSASSIVFKQNLAYSKSLSHAAEKLFHFATINNKSQGTYTSDEGCGGGAINFYNSSDYRDELVWGGTWLFFATGNATYLKYATTQLVEANKEEPVSEKGVFSWNNKISAIAVLMTRLRFFKDVGYPYEDALRNSTMKIDSLMCSYTSNDLDMTPGGLMISRPKYGQPLQFAATASFLSKLYSDYLSLLRRTGGSCNTEDFSVKMLRNFSASQVNYILGDNPMKLSYVVGYGDRYPSHVHHRSASIPWDGQPHTCPEGDRWLNSKDSNPNILYGAMVAGPDEFENFVDDRTKPWFTEPTISSNAGLVAALIAQVADSNDVVSNLRIDQNGMFEKINLA